VSREGVVLDTARVMTACLELVCARVVQSSRDSPARRVSLTAVLTVRCQSFHQTLITIRLILMLLVCVGTSFCMCNVGVLWLPKWIKLVFWCDVYHRRQLLCIRSPDPPRKGRPPRSWILDLEIFYSRYTTVGHDSSRRALVLLFKTGCYRLKDVTTIAVKRRFAPYHREVFISKSTNPILQAC